MVERSWFTACSGASRTDLSPRSPRRPPGGSDLALQRLPENSPVEAVTLEAPSRALVRVDMVTLNTPVPAKPVSRGGSCGGRLPGAAVTGSGRVPVEFQSDSASSSLPGTSGERLVSPGPCVTAGLQRIPAESLGSDVKVRAFSGLCVGVAERLPDTAPELHVLSSPRRTVPSTQARGVERTWTCEGLKGDRHHSRSTRQQQTRRRSTAWPRAGLEGRRLPSPPAAGSDTGDDPWESQRHGP
jgi:hypothetical protein